MLPRRRLPLLALLLLAPQARASGPGGERGRRSLPSSYQSVVTVYGAGWCGACKRLEQSLRERQIPYDLIDVDQNPSAHDRARQATGTSAIPVTSVHRGGQVTWIVGARIDEIERAYRN